MCDMRASDWVHSYPQRHLVEDRCLIAAGSSLGCCECTASQAIVSTKVRTPCDSVKLCSKDCLLFESKQLIQLKEPHVQKDCKTMGT